MLALADYYTGKAEKCSRVASAAARKLRNVQTVNRITDC
jgi:hypothetical protein